MIGPGEAAEWSRLLSGPAGPELSRLGVDFSRERAVVIGPRGRALDCAGIPIEVLGEEVRVRLDRAPSGGAASGGCVLVVPAARRGVDVVMEDRDAGE